MSSRTMRGVICALQLTPRPAKRRDWRSRATTTCSRRTAEAGARWSRSACADGRPTGDRNVDAVEQRAAEAALVAREVGGGAAAAVVAEAARARVRRRDEHAARREHHHPL